MKHKVLAVGIIFMFIITSVTPIVIGFDMKIKETDNELEATLANLRYMYSDERGFSEEKYEYYKQKYLNDYPKCDDGKQNFDDPVEKEIPDELLLTRTSGPMDSPWPMYGHDRCHTGRSPYNSTNYTSVEKWRFKCGRVQSSAIIDNNGIIYFGSGDRYAYALFPNGTIYWKFNIGSMRTESFAIAEDGTIYITSWSNYLYSLDPNGTEKWRYDLDTSPGTSPVLAQDGTIYVGTMYPNYEMNAVNPDGTEKWRSSPGTYITSDPAIGNDGTIYFGDHNGWFYALYPNNGTVKWSFHCGNDWVAGPPSIADDGTIYIGDYDGHLYAINPDGTMKWVQDIWYGTSGSPSIGKDGIIYVTSSSKLFAIYPNNGTIKWTFMAGSKMNGMCPLISDDGIIYVGSEIGDDDGGELIAINLNGTEIWRKIITNMCCKSSPIMERDGTIYIGSSWREDNGDWTGYLHAFGRGPLLVDAGGPYSGYAGNVVQFTGTVYGGIPPYTYHWDFGDDGTSDEQNPTHIYSDIGEYTAIFSVIDNEGNTSSDNTSVTIAYPPPIVNIIKPKKALYFMNLMIRPYLLDRKTLIFGLINIKASATNDYLDIERVEFFINNELVNTDEIRPYTWIWQGSRSLEDIYKIEVIAYDSEGKSGSDSIQVRKFL